MEFSQDLNRQILNEDNLMIQTYIDQSQKKFIKTSYGFWTSNLGETTSTMAKNLDVVKYEYEVKTLNEQLVYSKEENKTQTIVMGKTDLPRGLQIGLQMIEKGDSATLLFPSALAYGSYGDQNKIGGNEPLVFTIYMLDIQKKSK